MRITIAQRFTPFSHQPGTRLLLPGTDLRMEIYPTRIRVDRLGAGEAEKLAEISLTLKGPVKDFTISQDLEEGVIRVWGHSVEGYFCYRLHSAESGLLELHSERGISVLQEPLPLILSRAMALSAERLALGNHKKQDIDALMRAQDLTALLPLWLRLGQATPASLGSDQLSGTAVLLDRGFVGLRGLLQAGFEGLLSPRLVDTDYHGFELSPPSPTASPLVLLREGSSRIRKLFMEQRGQEIALLPALPPEFHAGRFCHIDCEGQGILDFEWSKKRIRRLVFTPVSDGQWRFIFREVSQFRLRSGHRDRGRIVDAGQLLDLKAGQPYLFDKFQR